MERFRQVLIFGIYFFGMINVSANTGNPGLNGKITGFVKDSINGEQLPYASLQLFSNLDSEIIRATVADSEGHFIFDDIDFGTYKIMASYIGYGIKEWVVNVDEKNETLCLLLSTNTFSINEVQVTGNRKLIETATGKTVVNVYQNTTLSAGTAFDALQTVPSVDVDFEGNISYRGSEQVMLLINGRKSALVKSLGQLPADAVEKIEVYSNPSANYESEGMSGIINIVLKSGTKSGDNTTFQLNAGDHDLLGGNIGYNITSGGTAFFINTGASHKKNGEIKNHFRANYNQPEANCYSQYDVLQEKQNNGFITTSFSYKINAKNNLTISASGTKGFTPADRFIDYTTVVNNGTTHHESNKNIEITINNYAFETELNYETIFNTNGQQLEAFVSYSENSGKNKMKNSLYYPNGSQLQNTSALQLNKEWYGEVEFLHPVNKWINFKGGYHLSDQNFRNHFNSESYDIDAANWNTDTELASRFTYHRHTEALSFVFGITNTTWDGDIGFRAEYTSTTQNQNNTQSGLEIFPTINLAGKVNGRHTIYFAYGRRINRPSVKMLDPFASKYADELNIHQGNPDLDPELVNSFEVGDRFSYEKFSGSVSLYYRYINQAISRVKLACNDSAVSVTYLNLGHATLGGCDFVFSYRPFTWCEITPAANFFSASLTGNAGSNIADGCEFAWNGSVSFLFRVPKILNLRMAGYYRSKLPSIMGTYKERWYADLAVSKKICKNKGQIIFKIEDVFDSYLYGLSVNSCTGKEYHYSQQNSKKIDSEYFMLSFIYNINGKSQSKKTEKDSFYLDSFEK